MTWQTLRRSSFDHHGKGMKSRVADVQKFARKAARPVPTKAQAKKILLREDASLNSFEQDRRAEPIAIRRFLVRLRGMPVALRNFRRQALIVNP